MQTVSSPWIQQLKRTRPVQPLAKNISTDVTIVGGGIAGMMTAYYALQKTTQRVVLLEGHQVAHGATGHNAGQIVSYFERPLSDLVAEYGLDMATQGQRCIDSAWQLLNDIYRQVKPTTPIWQFTGYAACSNLDEIIVHLKNQAFSRAAGLNAEGLLLASESSMAPQIPQEFDGHYTLVPHQDILKLLETEDTNYIAAVTARKGCLNSASLTEELAGYLLATYPNRFRLYESSPMHEVALGNGSAELKVGACIIRANRVVLCTNGFEHFTIRNANGPEINTKFHHLVRGSVGYMAAFIDERDAPPTAISYLPKRGHTGNSAFDSAPYFYLTRRPLEGPRGNRYNLICIGGPETLMDDTTHYSKMHPYPAEAQTAIDSFLKQTYAPAPSPVTYAHRWHGLMGYTPNGVRLIGFEPINPVLMYNLGCNGVGILPSIYGGLRIAQHLAGEKLAPSIFDPKLKAPDEN